MYAPKTSDLRVHRELKPTWRRKLFLLTAAIILAVAGIGAATLYFTYEPTTFTVAVGPPNSENVRVMQTFAQQLARERASVRLRVVVEAGPAQSAAAISSGTADLAIVRGDLGIPNDGMVVAILRHSVVALIVPAQGAKSAKETRKFRSGKIEKIQQLAGRRVGIVSRSDANLVVLNLILKQYDIPLDKVQVVNLDPSEVATAVRDDKVDALLVAGQLTGKTFADVVAAASTTKESATFLPIGEAEAIERRFPNYETAEIVANTFGSSPAKPAETIETIGFLQYIVANQALGEDRVAEFARRLYQARQTLSAELAAPLKIEAPSTDKDATVPVHPGAAAYLDGTQQTFFDRYNDLLYWGMILLSFCGSAGAGMVGYLRAGKQAQRSNLLERLIELMQAARIAAYPKELDTLEAEADAILAATIREVENQTVEERALTAFTLALDQARLAIADRRKALLKRPSTAPAFDVEHERVHPA
jgi:TRAP transporter TAXI family solute receptor